MIDWAINTLQVRGRLPPEADPDLSITLSGGINLRIIAPDGDWFFAKISDRFDLRNEFEGTRRGWELLPQQVAEPIAIEERDAWMLAIFQGVRHRPVVGNDLQASQGPVSDGLRQYFAVTRDAFRVRREAPSAHLEEFNGLLETMADPALRAPLRDWAASQGLAGLDALPRIRQHGDFTINNFGIAGNRLYIFDWEDFGRSEVPGLDLCTFVVSALGFDRKRVLAFVQGAEMQGLTGTARGACEDIGLGFSLFRRSFPLYLLHFLKLKGHYRGGITSRTGDVIRHLVDSRAL